MKTIFRLTGLLAITLLVGCTGPDVIVTDQDGKPVEGAKITGASLSISGQFTKTNSKGGAQIPKAVQQTKWITVSKAGYEDVQFIDVSQPKPICVKLVQIKKEG